MQEFVVGCVGPRSGDDQRSSAVGVPLQDKCGALDFLVAVNGEAVSEHLTHLLYRDAVLGQVGLQPFGDEELGQVIRGSQRRQVYRISIAGAMRKEGR